MRLAALLLLAAACRSDGSGGSGTAEVVAYLGSGARPAPGIPVVSHAPDGLTIETSTTDAVGEVAIGVDDDSLISVVFGQRVVTATVPADGAPLVVRGPDTSMPVPLVVGVVHVAGPAVTGATAYEIDVGCATVSVVQLPTAIDLTSCSVPTDQVVLLARAYHEVGETRVIDGYATARVPLLDGTAVFDISAWNTTGIDVPLDISGVAPAIRWTFYSSEGNAYDGMPIDPLADHAIAYEDFDVLSSTWHAVLAGANTARAVDAAYTGIGVVALTPDSFLPELTEPLQLVNDRFTWQPIGLETRLTHVHAKTTDGMWDVVLPADQTTVHVPAFLGAVSAIEVSLTHLRGTFGSEIHTEDPTPTVAVPMPNERVDSTAIAWP